MKFARWAVVFFLFVTLPAISAEAASPLSDRVEAVVVSGSLVPADMLGKQKGDYRLFADNGSGAAAIPFQIEERDDKGVILVEKGLDEAKLDGKFDARDELVFMARDTGPAAPAAPEGCAKSAVLTIKDKKTGATGYALLALCDTPPPLSDKDYITYDAKTYTVKAETYSMGWHQGRVFSYDYMSVAGGPDLLDRLKVRARVGKWGITYTFNEDDFHHVYVGYTDGPVRVTAKLDNYWSLGPLGKLPLAQYYYFYPRTLMLRSAMDINLNPFLLGFTENVEIGHDMEITDPSTARVCTNVTPECKPVNLPKEEADRLATGVMEWGGIDAPGGDVVIRLIPDPRLKTRVQGLYIYDPAFKAPPEKSVGSLPLISFNMVNWEDVEPDVYNLDFYYYFMKQFSTAEFERYDRMAIAPLDVSVSGD